MAGADPGLGLVLRTAAADATDPEIAAEIAALRAEWAALAAAGGPPAWRGPPPAPPPRRCATGAQPGDPVREAADRARRRRGLGGGRGAAPTRWWRSAKGSMAVEATRALVAVDVNTGGDLSPAAALKVNLAAAAELPRQLRLRGLGGQVTDRLRAARRAPTGRASSRRSPPRCAPTASTRRLPAGRRSAISSSAQARPPPAGTARRKPLSDGASHHRPLTIPALAPAGEPAADRFGGSE